MGARLDEVRASLNDGDSDGVNISILLNINGGGAIIKLGYIYMELLIYEREQ